MKSQIQGGTYSVNSAEQCFHLGEFWSKHHPYALSLERLTVCTASDDKMQIMVFQFLQKKQKSFLGAIILFVFLNSLNRTFRLLEIL